MNSIKSALHGTRGGYVLPQTSDGMVKFGECPTHNRAMCLWGGLGLGMKIGIVVGLMLPGPSVRYILFFN